MKNVCVFHALSPISAPLSKISVGKGLGRTTAIPSYKWKNWAAASAQGIVEEVSIGDVTHQVWWQIQLVILQNIQQWTW